jgi:hypothetical protein
MNPLWNSLLVCAISLGTISAGMAGTILTFDELATPQVIPTLNYGTIPNGYGGLLWKNFGVIDGLLRPASEGYNTGVVSPRNVAFNFDGRPAAITIGSGLFDLNSAQLTLALNLDTALNIEVQGYRNGTLIYDNTYTVYRFSPTAVTFDYLGIDTAKFITSPSQQFAMDNLIITVPEPGTAVLLLCAGLTGATFRRPRQTRPDTKEL